MTSAMRQAMLEEKMSKYSHVVLRVQFPDRLVLQVGEISNQSSAFL